MNSQVIDAYPLTALQAGMVFHSEMDRGLPTYRDVCSARVRAPFVEAGIRAALAHAVDCHDILRTAFDFDSFEEPLQLVHARATIPLEIEDLRECTPAHQDVLLAQRVRKAGEAGFRWSEPPLLRAYVQVLSDASFQLTLCFHHAILDGWSVSTLLAGLVQSYAAHLGMDGAHQPLRPRTNFRAYVAEERSRLRSADANAYWREYASHCIGTGPVWEISSAKPLEVLTVSVDPADLRALVAAGERWRVPLKSIFLSIHVRALANFTGTTSVTTGVITNTRLEDKDGDRVLGLFLNTLPQRVDGTDADWSTLVQGVFRQECEHLSHRRYPLAAIQRAAGGQPLFSVVFGYQQYHQWAQVRKDIGLALEDVTFVERTNYPLLVSASRNPFGTESRMLVKHHPEVVDARDAARLAALLHEAVCDLAASKKNVGGGPRPPSPDSLKSETPLPESPVHVLIGRVSASQPDTIAVRTTDRDWTYGQLDRRSNQLARRFMALGLGGDLVALVLGRGIELLLLQLALWKVGAVFVLLDPVEPALRRTRVLADSRPSLVVSADSDLRSLFDAADAELDTPLDSASRPDSAAAAYVLYTSGSSGTPKGVVVPHSALANVLVALAEQFAIRRGDVLVAVTTPAFDISLLEMWMPLLAGAAIRITTLEESEDPRRLATILDACEATFMQATPWRWRLLVESGWTGRPGLNILCGGDTLTLQLAQSLLVRGQSVWNLYGPTEATIWCSARRIQEGTRRIDIGRPLRGLQMSVRDAAGKAVRAGATGELWVTGAGVAMGYLNRSQETAERFVTDVSGRAYRTGDLARELKDGSFELLGRSDDQVKIRGVRVELSEITAALLAHPAVHDAHAGLRQEDAQLVAYVAVADRARIFDVAKALSSVLPRALLPSSYVAFERLPRLTNGKIDRRALADAQPVYAPAHPATSPRNDLERQVLAIWEQVLRRPGISIHDTLTDAGGDSISALRIAARLEKATGLWVPLSDLVSRATVASVAARLGTTRPDLANCAIPMADCDRPNSAPLFLVHPLGGHVFSFHHLAEALGTRHSVVGLRARGLAPGEQPLRDIRAMSNLYLEAIRAVQPVGPYAIAGWCMGGIIAVEIARNMLVAGEQVRFLGILSTPVLPTLPEGIALRKHVLAQHVEIDMGQLEGMAENEQIQRMIELARASGGLRPDVTDVEVARRLVAVYEAHTSALQGYEPAPYTGSAIYFSPVDSGAAGDEHVNAWRQLVRGEFGVERIAGDPYSFLMDGNAKQLASRIDHYLEF